MAFLCGPYSIKGEPVSVSVFSPLSLQDNHSVKTFPQQRIVQIAAFSAVKVV
jgi:hypothetical protein